MEALSGPAALYAQWGAENFGHRAKDFIGNQDFLLWAKEQIFKWNKRGLFSHAETVCWAHSLLRNHPNELALIRERYPVVIIDEFQDTDIAQWDLVQYLEPKSLIVMADSAQTIHIWRGADPDRIEQLRAFCEAIPTYKTQKATRLDTLHRAPKPMSSYENITWRELSVSADPADKRQVNLAKRYTKAECKAIARKSKQNGKTVGILCLTNAMADDITSFLRMRQTFEKGGYLSGIACIRLGAENSPFDLARCLALQLLDDLLQKRPEELQNSIANSILQTLMPCQIKPCLATSKNIDLKNRWTSAGRIARLLHQEFGLCLRELVSYATAKARSMHCHIDLGIIGCLRHVGIMISRVGVKRWMGLSYEEKRRKIDSAVLQYENALAFSRDIAPVSVMTVHQSKSREFSVVIVPWFTNIPWSPTDSVWDTSRIDHEKLFHTACTRAMEEAIVIFPKGQAAVWPPTR